jgi:hypothetical protein
MKTDVSKFNITPQMGESSSESFVSPLHTTDDCLRGRPQEELQKNSMALGNGYSN